jgi:integrase
MPRRLPPGIRQRTLPDGSLRYDVRVELPPDPRSGKRRTPSRTFADREEAERELRRLLTELDEGIVIAPDRLTVGDLLQRWLDQEVRHRVRPTTLEGYTATVRVHVLPYIGRQRSQALAPADVAALRSTLLRATGVRSTQLALLRLSQALAWGVSVELLKRNVASGIKRPPDTTSEKRALTHAEARAFLEIAETDHYAPLWRLYLATGLRRGEGLGLRWRDLDLDAQTLSVRQQIVLGGKPARPMIQEPKSVAARRTIDIDVLTIKELAVHKERQFKAKQRVVLWQHLDLVFCTRHGTPLNPTNVLRNFRLIRDEAGLDPDITLHNLRHTHATHLILGGVPILEVSRRLGHSKTSITLDTYGHLLADYRGASVDAVAAALDGGLPELSP